MLETPGTPLDWSLQFTRQQKEIIELWQSCCVPLTHRTYFFLLFRGDPTDSIYMEVELRRLSFLKETFSDGNQSVRNSQTITLASRFCFLFLSLLHVFQFLLLFGIQMDILASTTNEEISTLNMDHMIIYPPILTHRPLQKAIACFVDLIHLWLI